MAPEQSARQLPIILALGTTQTLAWASSYYLPAILADPIARDLGVSSNWIFAAFSASLVISALLGPRVGRQIDLVGGRQVLSISNLTLAAGLALLGATHSIPLLVVAWLLLGVGMGFGLVRCGLRRARAHLWRRGARRDHRHHADGRVCLDRRMAADAWGLDTIGWRNTCFAWAAAHILIGLPINFFMLPAVKGAKAAVATAIKPHIPIDRTMVLLAFTFAAAWTVTGAMAAHHAANPRGRGGHHAAGGGGRRAVRPGASGCAHHRGEFSQPLSSAAVDPACLPDAPDRRRHPRTSGRRGSKRVRDLSSALGNGILTIARGTLPLAIFGPQNYGYRLGIIGAPARMAQAAAPLVFGLLIDTMGSRVLIVSSALSLSALVALLLLRQDPPAP